MQCFLDFPLATFPRARKHRNKKETLPSLWSYNAVTKMVFQSKNSNEALSLALIAVFAAVVFVATYSFVIPIPATSGYFNLGETTIYIAALIFGPLVGALAGGVGSMIADTLLAPQFAPGTLVIKSIEGAIVAFLSAKLKKHVPSFTIRASISIVIGGFEMVAGYFIYEQLVLGYPLAAALAEVPFNLIQMLVGLVVAVPVVHAVLRVFPQLKS
jgi:uncharacterized membrane protein